jgi:hypothetical protein
MLLVLISMMAKTVNFLKCKLAQVLWKATWRALKQLKIELSFDSS